MKDRLQEWNKEMLELNRKSMELKTELRLVEARRKELFEEHNAIIMELQYELNKKQGKEG